MTVPQLWDRHQREQEEEEGQNNLAKSNGEGEKHGRLEQLECCEGCS